MREGRREAEAEGAEESGRERASRPRDETVEWRLQAAMAGWQAGPQRCGAPGMRHGHAGGGRASESGRAGASERGARSGERWGWGGEAAGREGRRPAAAQAARHGTGRRRWGRGAAAWCTAAKDSYVNSFSHSTGYLYITAPIHSSQIAPK